VNQVRCGFLKSLKQATFKVKMSIRKRIFLALAAGVFGQLVTFGTQILLIPLFFLHWGAAKYGEWLLISTIPAYLVMADFGIGSAAGNEMTMRAGAGDYEGAQTTFRGAIRLCSLVSSGVMIFSITVGVVCLWFDIPDTRFILPREAATLIILFGLGVCLNFYLGAISSGFRCSGKNATSLFLGNVSRLIETLFTALVLWADFSPAFICFTCLLVKLIFGIFQIVLLRSYSPWLFNPKSRADKMLVKRLLKPSLAFLAFPVGNAIALQVPLLLLGAVFGSSSVAIFSALRTLARIPIQIANVFNASIWPEMSSAYGSGNFMLLRKLHQNSWMMTILLTASFVITIAFFGEMIVNVWLHEQNVYNRFLLHGLLAMSFFAAVYGVSTIVLVAINAHAKMSAYYLSVNSIGCFLSYFAALHLGIQGYMYSLILIELVTLSFVLPMALRVSKDSLRSFIGSVFDNFSHFFLRNSK
jgi:O-antigen/teichoic acid export membrane protein